MLDLIVIAIIIVSGIVGIKLGFIRTVYQLISSLLALGLAIMVYPIIVTILKLTPLYENIKNWVQQLMPSFEMNMGLQAQGTAIQEVTKWLPEFITDKIVANNNPEIYELLGVTKFIDYIVVSLANLCIAGIAIILAWILIKIVLSIGVGILDLVSKLPLIKTANQLAGGVVGVIKGVFIVWLGCLVVPFLILIPNLSQLEYMINQSIITKILYEQNIILQVITGFLFK